MTKYQIRFFGSVGVKPLDFEEDFINDTWALRAVEQRLGNYFPVYYDAAVWKVDGETSVLLGEYKAEVTIVRKPGARTPEPSTRPA